MTNHIQQYYSTVINEADRCLKIATEKDSTVISEIHQKISDLTELLNTKESSEEHILFEPVSVDIQMSLFLVLMGAYRQSYFSLRRALETTVAGIYFSTRNLDLKKWIAGDKDISWSEVAFSKDAVITKEFASIFFNGSEIHIPEYEKKARHVYSKLSGYVHGEKYTNHIEKIVLKHQPEEFNNWKVLFDQIFNVVFFCFLVRYIEEMPAEQIEELQPYIDAELGNLPVFQTKIGGPVER